MTFDQYAAELRAQEWSARQSNPRYMERLREWSAARDENASDGIKSEFQEYRK